MRWADCAVDCAKGRSECVAACNLVGHLAFSRGFCRRRLHCGGRIEGRQDKVMSVFRNLGSSPRSIITCLLFWTWQKLELSSKTRRERRVLFQNGVVGLSTRQPAFTYTKIRKSLEYHGSYYPQSHDSVVEHSDNAMALWQTVRCCRYYVLKNVQYLSLQSKPQARSVGACDEARSQSGILDCELNLSRSSMQKSERTCPCRAVMSPSMPFSGISTSQPFVLLAFETTPYPIPKPTPSRKTQLIHPDTPNSSQRDN